MNKIHLHWVVKPTWQLCLYQCAIFSGTILVIYLLVLRTEWLTIVAGRNQVITTRLIVEQHKQRWLSLPTFAAVQGQINGLPFNQEQQHNKVDNLVQRINQPLSVAGGQLLTWRPKEELIGKNVVQWSGHLVISVTYWGLIKFLQEILLLQPPIKIEKMNIHMEQHGLITEFELSEYPLVGGYD